MKLYTHPDYTKFQKEWSLYKTFYDGKHSELVNNSEILWPLYIETKGGGPGAELLAERKQRTRYLNIVEIIISLWVSFFFRTKPVLNAAALELLEGAEDNIDGRGTILISFLKSVLEDYLVYGKSIVLVDSLSQGQNLRPFAQKLSPLDLVDWDIETLNQERVGKLNAARRIYYAINSRVRLTEEPTMRLFSDEYFLSDSGVFSKQTYQLEDEKKGKDTPTAKDLEWITADGVVESELLEIPMIVTNTESWVKDVCEEVLRHFNLRSSKDSIEHQQAYQKVFLLGVDSKDIEVINAISQFHYPILPRDASVVVVPSSSTADIGMSVSNALENAFKMGLNQLRQVASDSGSVQSANTIDAEKDDRLALVESTLGEMEHIGNQILYYFGQFKGQEALADEAVIEFNKEVTKDDIDSFIVVYNSFKDVLLKYPDLQPLLAKKVVGKLLSGEDQKTALELIEAGAQTQITQAPDAAPAAQTQTGGGLFDLGL